ncbi:acid phosphatase/Vanadium-dependent haloperoxidase [Basidiobolus meristosporus CBS 931.73]|uniref:Acid phosphatase/Vanadium-dependent haloperoxidase n=1 Tax=Basidiobolus meristosporus CBS 931.73 TaxID=1314790 RepID=A0A1Y1YG96_9FUNG|nr:acid phosphatase/Vanadium-dependent haloperoxidase [Basidiobolus meristosporus CBS 931.73]|eukprot:ORX97041.1 acid phosphatase/Vanadium-dependent haloperoxidase [Basidiobolus meristosporus CBS 931.73]
MAKNPIFKNDYPPGHLKTLILSYFVDWVIVGLLALGFFLVDKIPPFHRLFSLDNKSISFPHKQYDTIPMSLAAVLVFVLPLILMALVSLLIRRSPYDCHNSMLGLCLAMTLTLMITHVLKVTVGRHRPDFISRCQPMLENGQEPKDPPLGLTSVDVCTQTNAYVFTDGMKSFPSGHTSLSFAGLTFLSCFLAGKLHLFDERGHTYKSFVSIGPMVGAALIGVSRICDYRHHWQDVTVGALIGICCAYFSYRQYYPQLGSPECHKPFSPRIPRPIARKVEVPGSNSQDWARMEGVTVTEANMRQLNSEGLSP